MVVKVWSTRVGMGVCARAEKCVCVCGKQDRTADSKETIYFKKPVLMTVCSKLLMKTILWVS